MDSRREFIKNSAIAMLSTSVLGCSANLNAGVYKDRFQQSPNYQDGAFKNLIKTNLGHKPGTLLDIANDWMFGKEEREPLFKIPVNRLESSVFNLIRVMKVKESDINTFYSKLFESCIHCFVIVWIPRNFQA